jgi:hypothetical protein
MSGVTGAAIAVGVAGIAAGAIEASQSQGIAKQSLGLAATQAQKQNQSYVQLQNLMQDPSAFLNNPLFQSTLNVGLSGVSRQMAAQGYLGSGNQMTALEQYAQSSASSQLLAQEQLLAGMSGTGFNPAGSLNVGTGANNQSFQQLGTVLYALGQTGGFGGGGFSGGGFTPMNDPSMGGTTAGWGAGADAIATGW